MKVIVCLDEQGAMRFHERRVSSDRNILRDILRGIGAADEKGNLRETARDKVVIYPFSQDLWEPFAAFTRLVQPGYFPENTDILFVEEADRLPPPERIDTLEVYRFQRTYPIEERFPFPLQYWKRKGIWRLAGFSHDLILKELYERQEARRS